MPTDIRILGPGDEALLRASAPGVFDDAGQPPLARQFLSDARHLLSVAIDGSRIVAMASGVLYVHPDKPTELWINELGTAPSHRGRGLAKAVLGALLARARERGCGEAWVLTDRGNEAAMRVYEGLGGVQARMPSVMFTFRLPGPAGPDAQTIL